MTLMILMLLMTLMILMLLLLELLQVLVVHPGGGRRRRRAATQVPQTPPLPVGYDGKVHAGDERAAPLHRGELRAGNLVTDTNSGGHLLLSSLI